jgi:hypothetical protein
MRHQRSNGLGWQYQYQISIRDTMHRRKETTRRSEDLETALNTVRPFEEVADRYE